MLKALSVILVGFVYFAVNAIREWSVSATPDNAMAVNGYANTAIFGLWIMVAGFAWLMLRKK